MKVWKTRTCDTKFNKSIVERDKRCVKCGSIKMLTCSHFWGVSHSATRYDPENCDTLCYPCHYGNKVTGWEHNKQGEYRDFKIKQLGEEKYTKLMQKANKIKSLLEARKEFMQKYASKTE